jgi:hypothetical protein
MEKAIYLIFLLFKTILDWWTVSSCVIFYCYFSKRHYIIIVCKLGQIQVVSPISYLASLLNESSTQELQPPNYKISLII